MEINKTKILILVEGEKTDVKLMQKLLSIYGLQINYEIVSYNSNIYSFYNEMFKEHHPEDYDLLKILKSKEKDLEKKKIFDSNYSDIILIFDFDPQDPQYNIDKILEMNAYFKESSDMGKLYINYPMVESFYHMKTIPDEHYNDYYVEEQTLKDKKYKSYVNKISYKRDYNKFANDKLLCNIVFKQNFEKAKKIANYNEYDEQSLTKVLKEQTNLYRNSKYVYVLCSCIFYFYDYNPNLLN